MTDDTEMTDDDSRALAAGLMAAIDRSRGVTPDDPDAPHEETLEEHFAAVAALRAADAERRAQAGAPMRSGSDAS